MALSGGPQASGLKPVTAVATGDEGLIVGGDKEGCPLFAPELRQEFPDRPGVVTVEPRRRLVGEKQQRPEGERAGHGDTLLLAARKRVRSCPHATREPHGVKSFAGPLLGVRVPAESQRETHVFEDVEKREELDVLKDESEMSQTQGSALVFLKSVEIFPAKQHPSFARRLETGGQREKSRLARARDAEQGRSCAPLEGQAHAI